MNKKAMMHYLSKTDKLSEHGHARETRTRSGEKDKLRGHGHAQSTRTRSGETDTLRGHGHAQRTRIRSGNPDTLRGHGPARKTRTRSGDTLGGHGAVTVTARYGPGTLRSRHGRNTKKLQTRNYHCIKSNKTSTFLLNILGLRHFMITSNCLFYRAISRLKVSIFFCSLPS